MKIPHGLIISSSRRYRSIPRHARLSVLWTRVLILNCRRDYGIVASDEDLNAIAQQLKKQCGSGGTVKDGSIEIQGDHCEKVQARLTEMGYKVKRAGG